MTHVKLSPFLLLGDETFDFKAMGRMCVLYRIVKFVWINYVGPKCR